MSDKNEEIKPKKVSSFSDILKIWFAMRYDIPIDKKDKVKITDKKGKEVK